MKPYETKRQHWRTTEKWVSTFAAVCLTKLTDKLDTFLFLCLPLDTGRHTSLSSTLLMSYLPSFRNHVYFCQRFIKLLRLAYTWGQQLQPLGS